MMRYSFTDDTTCVYTWPPEAAVLWGIQNPHPSIPEVSLQILTVH